MTAVVVGPVGVHTSGRSVATTAMFEHFATEGLPISVVDTCRYRGRRGERLMRLTTYVRAAFELIRHPNAPLYLAYPDGEELLAATPLVLAAAVLKRPVVVHHHSRRYVDKRTFLVRPLRHAERRVRVVHVVQCERLGERMRKVYGFRETLAMSNAALVNVPDLHDGQEFEAVEDRVRLGFFGTLSVEKGLGRFVEMATSLLQQYPNCEIALGGRIAEEADLAPLERLMVRHAGRVLLVGPLFGSAKFDFLASLDVLVFPTSYRTETEGIVILEALAVGCTVVATDIGCIAEVIDGTPGAAFDDPAEILGWLEGVVSGAIAIDRSPNTDRLVELRDTALDALADVDDVLAQRR